MVRRLGGSRAGVRGSRLQFVWRLGTGQSMLPLWGMPSRMRPHGNSRRVRAAAKPVALALAVSVLLAGCFSETFQRGYVLPEGSLEQIPLGATQEQVLIVLGTPSTVATVSGEAFYYISQRTERAAAFLPQKVVDQRVVAVYFDKNRRVERLANYGLRDGKIFDFVSRTTPTGGEELNYLRSFFRMVNQLAP
jgi:outer membrane protein assembly factor BamE (lipoprotein component of BamABCDE complex)